MLEPRDMLIKTMAMVFLNPEDKDGVGKKVFIQQFLGCGCPDDVVEQAKIRFLSHPLGAFLETGAGQAPRSEGITRFEKNINPFLKLPKTLKWPRTTKAKIIAPSRWLRSHINSVAKNEKQAVKLTHLRAMCNATIDVVIEVPGRAFFFIVVEERIKLKKGTLLTQYESGQLLYQLMGYNRCRLFTVTEEAGPKRIPQIDTALTWGGLYSAFDTTKGRYAFASAILDLFESIKAGGSGKKLDLFSFR